jgi:hypothetical protein
LIRHDRPFARRVGMADANVQATVATTAAAKEVVMKNLLLKSLGALSVVGMLASAVPAHATDVRAKIPFSFSVSKQTLPAGTYTVSTGNGFSTLMIRGSEGGALSLSQAVEDRNQEGAKLVFHRYGDHYVLTEVWSGTQGRKLPESKAERELIARNGVASMQVVEIAIPKL